MKVVKASFGQRRKMIRNSLRSVFGNFGGAEHPFFTQRAEQLSVADFVELDRLSRGEQNAVRSPCAASCTVLCVCGHTLCDRTPATMCHGLH